MLREGTGPAAVRRRDDLGDVSVVYVTGQPERCADADDAHAHAHAHIVPIRSCGSTSPKR